MCRAPEELSGHVATPRAGSDGAAKLPSYTLPCGTMPQPSWRPTERDSACCAPSARPPPLLAQLTGEERWVHPPVRVKGRSADRGGFPVQALFAQALDAPLLPAQQQQVPLCLRRMLSGVCSSCTCS